MRLDDLALVNAERAARRAVAFVTDLGGGAQRVVTAAAVAGDPLADDITERLRSGKSGIVRHAGRDLFVTVHVPPVRLVVVGAVHISQALVEMATLVEIDTIVVDPRTAFATPDRFPGADLRAQWPDEVLPDLHFDAFTAVALLTHDPKIDDQALVAALRSPCFYIGALGSRATHGRRLDRMRAEGFGEDNLARIRAPIGLDIGALTPPEIAVSILGEIIDALGRKRKRSDSRPGTPETGQAAGSLDALPSVPPKGSSSLMP